MENTDLILFKRAISEGLENRLKTVIDSCPESIIPSPRHYKAMSAIMNESGRKNKSLTPKMRRLIAILVAAALLLAGCAIIYRNEIRDFIVEICETFVKVDYSVGEDEAKELEDVYELTYVPEGFNLEKNVTTFIFRKYEYLNTNGNFITFEQRNLDQALFFADVESGYTIILNIDNYYVYYKNVKTHGCYIWNDGKYSFRLISDIDFSIEEVKLIVEGALIETTSK